MSLPPLSALRAFEAAARHESLSRAADELCVTHAAVSHQLRRLEEWFGAPLMSRHGRRVRLTTVGQALAAHLTPLFGSLEDACVRVRRMTSGGSLVVGCLPSVANRWLIPRLKDFSAGHPDAEIKIVYAAEEERLADGRLDVLITYGDAEAAGAITSPLFSRRSIPVCSPTFLRTYGPFERPEAIAAAPLLHDESRHGWSEWLTLAGLPISAATCGIVYQDANLLMTAAIAGNGIALCPVEVFREELEHGNLIAVSDIATQSDKGYFIQRRGEGPQIAEAFVTWFMASIAATPGAMYPTVVSSR